MNRFTTNLVSGRLRSLMFAAVVAVAGLGCVGSARADACLPTYRYEWAVRYETRLVPYTVCETRYDRCGNSYQVQVTRYRTERVAVWQRVGVRIS